MKIENLDIGSGMVLSMPDHVIENHSKIKAWEEKCQDGKEEMSRLSSLRYKDAIEKTFYTFLSSGLFFCTNTILSKISSGFIPIIMTYDPSRWLEFAISERVWEIFKECVYREGLKNRELDEEAPQIFWLKQGALSLTSPDVKTKNMKQSRRCTKTDSSFTSGIKPIIKNSSLRLGISLETWKTDRKKTLIILFVLAAIYLAKENVYCENAGTFCQVFSPLSGSLLSSSIIVEKLIPWFSNFLLDVATIEILAAFSNSGY